MMRSLARKTWTLLSLVAVTVSSMGLLAGCESYTHFSDSYILDAYYDSMNAVRANGAIMRGWVPEFLPETVTAIHERHSVDTNEGWGAFEFSKFERSDFEANWRLVQLVPWPSNPNRFPRVAQVDWWPDNIRGNWLLYKGIQDSDFFVAIDLEHNKGYFWQ